MFDLYALPPTFPGYADAQKCVPPGERVLRLEEAFAHDLSHPRFIPYIQLHEFEALLLAEPAVLASEFFEREAGIARLTNLCAQYASPELINDGPTTAPSKRLIQEIPEYEHRKASAGPLVAARIGLPTLRLRCPHFNDWLSKLEQLTAPDAGQRPGPRGGG